VLGETKVAILTSIQVFLETGDCTEQEFKKVIIAEAFGSYFSMTSAITIGMLPSLPSGCLNEVGNAADGGAKYALILLTHRIEAQSIASGVQNI